MEKTHWLCILNRENWGIVKRNGIWGVSERYKKQLHKAKIGDVLIFYCIGEKYRGKRKEPEITGMYEVASDSYKDSKKIFSSTGFKQEIFPYRIKVKPIKIFEKPIAFKPLVGKVKFITNRKRYGVHLFGKAMIRIPKEDYETIVALR